MIDALYNGGLNLVADAWWTTMAWPPLACCNPLPTP